MIPVADRAPTADPVAPDPVVAAPVAAGRRRRRGPAVLAGTAAALVAVAAVGATALGLGGPGLAALGLGGAQQGTAVAGTLPPATATVTRQTLADTETVSGELGHGTTRTAVGRLTGTVTWLPATGAVIRRGRALYRVDDTPVVLLYGSMPAYRVLAPDARGADVEQFERNLKALGYDGFTVDDDYTWATAAAVERWQDDLGLEQTGRVEPARIGYAAAAVRVDSHSAAVGDSVQPGKAVLAFTGTAPVVTVRLDVDDQRLAREGAAVTFTMPDGDRAAGRITDVQTVVETSTAANGQPSTENRIEVTATARDPKLLAGYDRASVDVDFTASQRRDVLTVPVAALLALAEGGYGVQLVEGGTTRVVAVRTGLFAAGRVEVTGIAEGTVVGMPR